MHRPIDSCSCRQPGGRTGLFLASLLFAAGVAGGLGPAAAAGQGDDVGTLAGQATEMLNLRGGTIISLDIDPTRGMPITITVPLGDERFFPADSLYTLELTPYSVRSWAFEVRAQLDDGSYVTVDPGPARTLRGSVAQIEDSAAAAALLTDGLYAVIALGEGIRYWIEPLGSRLSGAAPNDYILYRDDDVIPSGGTCIVKESPFAAAVAAHEFGGIQTGGGARGDGEYVAELACDADVEYYQTYGSVEATEAQIEAIINAMDIQYDRDVGIEHFITTIIVRTSEPDPYTTSNPDSLLNQFTNYWNSNHQDIQRDVAQLFTGKNLSGSVIGIAWKPGVCTSSHGYSVVQSNCCSGFGCKTDLSAHELAHNWDAGHCNCSGWTMNTGLTCANQFHPSYTIPDIVAYRNAQNCLDPPVILLGLRVTGPEEVEENGTAQYTATATFVTDPPEDVTDRASWHVAPGSAGSFPDRGLFAAAEADGDLAATILASYYLNGVIVTDDLLITILDTNEPLVLLSAEPPDGAIDARQPSENDGSNPAGWQTVELTFSGDAFDLTPADFTITQEGGALPPPEIVAAVPITANVIRLMFSERIEPGAWTIITHLSSGYSTAMGYLPADVGADGMSSSSDILALIDALNGVGDPLPDWSTDTNRSGLTDPSDILQVIDLLNGAGSYDPWNGVSLP